MFFIRIACNFKNIICLVFIEVTQLINVLAFSDVWGVIIKKPLQFALVGSIARVRIL